MLKNIFSLDLSSTEEWFLQKIQYYSLILKNYYAQMQLGMAFAMYNLIMSMHYN